MKRFKVPSRKVVLQWVAIVVAVALTGYVVYSVNVQRLRVAALADALSAEQEAAEARGDQPVADDPETIIDDPGAEVTAGPTDDQVDDAVAAYFAEHPAPDGDVSESELVAAVAAYFADNPVSNGKNGATGPGPTDEQVSAAVTRYFEANPVQPGEQGEKGETGETGRPPTAEEIGAAVQAWIDANGLPACPEGSTPEAHTLLTLDGGTVDVVVCVVS